MFMYYGVFLMSQYIFPYNAHTGHYGDVIMGAIASQITSLTIVYSTIYSDADKRKHQSSASLAFVWGIHRGLVNSPHKWPVTRKMFPFDDVITDTTELILEYRVHISWNFLHMTNLVHKQRCYTLLSKLVYVYASRCVALFHFSIRCGYRSDVFLWGLYWAFQVESCRPFTHNLSDFIIGTGAILRLGMCQWGNPGRYKGLILRLRLANGRRRYFVTTSLIEWAQT